MEQVLYSLPDGWDWKAIEKVAQIGADRGFAPTPDSEGNVPFIGMTDIDQETGQKSTYELRNFDDVKKGYTKFQRNAVLFAKITPCTENNKTALIDNVNGGFATTEVFPIHALDSIEPKYLLHFFRSPSVRRFLIDQMEGATGRQRVPLKALKSVSVPVCGLEEQKRIAEKLDALLTRIDTAIEHLQENLATSKSLLASALFEKFHQEVSPTPIKDIFNVYNGRAYKKTELLDSGKYKVIRIQNLKGGENYYYSDLELDENKYCESGDLLFSWSGTPGTSFGAFNWNDERAIYHYHIWKMEPKVDIAPRYAYWVLKDITEDAIANARGVAGMLHITKGTMESFIVSLPTYETQQKIAKELDELALKSEQLQAEISLEIDSLKHLKASILDSAFKGEL